MRPVARILGAAVIAVAALAPALLDPAPVAAAPPQQPAPGIAPPAHWATWDRNGDDQLTIDEFQMMSDPDREALQAWLDDALASYDDNDVRAWADDHLDFVTRTFLDIPAPGIADQVGDAPGEIRDAVTGAAADAARGVANSAFDAVASRVGEASADLTGFIGEEMARTGRPQLEADWYVRHYQRMLGWAGLLILPLAVVGVSGAVLRGDSARVGHTLLQVPLVYLIGVLAISVISAATGLAAAMSRSVVPGMQDASRQLGERVAELMVVNRMSPGLVLLLGLVIAIAAIVTLLWLLLAEAALYAVVLFIPLAFAGRVWEPARDWGRKLLTVAFSLVAAKVVIFAVWALAVDGLASASANDVPLRSALALAALLVMTALAPTAALRLVPMLEGVERAGSPGGAMRAGLSNAYYTAGVARMGASRAAGSSGRSGGLPVTGQIGGAAARTPTAAGGPRSADASVQRSATGRAGGGPGPTGARGREARGPGAQADQRHGTTSGRGPAGSSPAPSRGSGDPTTIISTDPPRVAPPASPPGTGRGSPWRGPRP